MFTGSPPGGLGSLAQSARKQTLASARAILIFVGILGILGSFYFMSLARPQVRMLINAEVAKGRAEGLEYDDAAIEDAIETATRLTFLINGGLLLLNVVFVVLGCLVHLWPVPVTVTALTLYIATNLALFLLNPMNVAGILIKVIIALLLVKAVTAAVAFQREARAVASAAPGSPVR